MGQGVGTPAQYGRASSRGGALLLALACAVIAAPAVDAAAPEEHTIRLRLATSIMWDSNVFRVPDSAPDPQLARGIPGKSDRIATTTLGLLIDKAYALQRFQLDASQTAKRNDNFAFLNLDAFQYHGAWLWNLSPRVSGTLSASHTKSLVPLTDLASPQRNVRVTDNRTFNLDGQMFGGWHVLAGAVNAEMNTSQAFLAQPGHRTNAAEVGLKYVAVSGNLITATKRSTRGTIDNLGQGLALVNFIAQEFRVQEREVKTTWKTSGKSTLSGRLTRLDRHNQNLPQRDFSGTSGELSYSWALDGRLLLNFSASQNISPWTADTQASYRVDDRLSFTPSLLISERVTVHVSADRHISDFRGPVGPLPGPSRHDILRSLRLAVDWSPPVRNLLLTGALQRDRRSSNAAGLDFDDTMATLSVSLAF